MLFRSCLSLVFSYNNNNNNNNNNNAYVYGLCSRLTHITDQTQKVPVRYRPNVANELIISETERDFHVTSFVGINTH